MSEQISLRQATKDAAQGKLNYLIPSPSPTRYLQKENIPSTGIRANREAVINGIWDFAQHFEGHEGDNADQSDVEIYDPLDVPVGDYLDFFSAAQSIWDLSKQESDALHFYNPIKKKQLESVRNNIGEDAERVAEALVYAVADVLASDNPELARLIGRLEVDLSSERSAEDIDSAAEVNFAMHAGNITNSSGQVDAGKVMAQSSSISLMSETEEEEDQAEKRRVKDTKKILKIISPQLKEMHLLEVVNDWIGFSN